MHGHNKQKGQCTRERESEHSSTYVVGLASSFFRSFRVHHDQIPSAISRSLVCIHEHNSAFPELKILRWVVLIPRDGLLVLAGVKGEIHKWATDLAAPRSCGGGFVFPHSQDSL